MFSKFDNTNLYTCETFVKSFQNKNSLNKHKATHIEYQAHVIYAIKSLHHLKISSNTKVQCILKMFSIALNVPKSFTLIRIWENMWSQPMKKNLWCVHFVRIGLNLTICLTKAMLLFLNTIYAHKILYLSWMLQPFQHLTVVTYWLNMAHNVIPGL